MDRRPQVVTSIQLGESKRRYQAHFISKLSDADGEAAETQSWLDFALENGYITQQEYTELDGVYETISGGLVKMMDGAENWCGPAQHSHTPKLPYSSKLPHSSDSNLPGDGV